MAKKQREARVLPLNPPPSSGRYDFGRKDAMLRTCEVAGCGAEFFVSPAQEHEKRCPLHRKRDRLARH